MRMTRESARRPRPRFNFSVFAVLQCLIKSYVPSSFRWAHGSVPTGMDDLSHIHIFAPTRLGMNSYPRFLL